MSIEHWDVLTTFKIKYVEYDFVNIGCFQCDYFPVNSKNRKVGTDLKKIGR